MREPDEHGGGDDGEDDPVGQDVHAAEELVEAAVLELNLDLAVGELGQDEADLIGQFLRVTGVLQRVLLDDLEHVRRACSAR